MQMNPNDITKVLISADEIDQRLGTLAAEVSDHYASANAEKDLILIGVLTGATIVMSDFSRKLSIHSEIDWLSLSSYGSGTRSSGVIRVLKDLSVDVKGRDVLIVEDIIDSGLTLAWLVQNLKSRGAKSVEIITLLKKIRTDGRGNNIVAKWIGFEIPDEFVVGYGLDYAHRYRTLPFVGILSPDVYEAS